MSTELKNCPFCGSRECCIVREESGSFVPYCTKCFAFGPPSTSKKRAKGQAEATERWNARAGQEWLPVESYDKESCPEVLLSIYDTETKRKFLIIGHFIPRFSTEYYDDFGDDGGERKPDPDDDGTSYCHEGWYEVISSNACDYSSYMISEKWTVLYWMPLPKVPEVGNE